MRGNEDDRRGDERGSRPGPDNRQLVRGVSWPTPPGRPTLPVVGLIMLVWFGLITRIGHYDVDVFLRAGAAVRHGLDPYPAPGTGAVYSGFAFVYPYLTAMPFAPLSCLAHADDIFVAGSVLALLGGTHLAGARDWRVYALVIAPSCTIIGLQMGTLNALLFAGLALAWQRRDRPWTCGGVVALLVYSKLFLAPLLLWLLLARRLRAWMVALAGLGALFLAGELLSPVGTATYVGMLDALARAEAPNGLSLTGLLVNIGVAMEAAASIARLCALAVLAVCWAATRRGHDERLLFAGAVAAAILASPIVWSHYLLLLVAPLLVLSAPRPSLADAGVGPGCRVGSGAPIGPDPAVGSGTPVRPGTAAGSGTPVEPPTCVGPVSPGPTAAFAVSSWFLVTPHRSTTMELLAVTAILGPLVLSSLHAGRTSRPSATRRRTVAAAGGRAATPARLRLAVGLGLAVVFGLGDAVVNLAAGHSAAGRVVGAYGTLVGVVTLVAWAGHVTARDRGLRTAAGDPLARKSNPGRTSG
ncbi:hypothetical protein ThrDRAFT_02263 [Frankia casuarinae]|uniref:DUF2029 domain-containing protein n=1 Tax=Frankia casuarinae (strain DSM 45818 / CECT 9043 / HFP020203 / CcI3) TaxID=106370 RepID=Q2J920_FRACC|nr:MULTISPECIES: glycosyltransferase 87 family protein [Frankia]ABD12222.1 hypothetical protein Francci3_2864 [Frankia casuarinae]EYT92150.1 hypothetical protein ThrDRAFT_02263 [Frankia casuarinae]KDA43181.1 hypothetical protein BMG523Draft_02055 [Frankia sp. BMG5.23]